MKWKRLSIRQAITYLIAVAAMFLARPQWPAFAIGCVLAAVGVAFRIWGCGHLRKNEQLITSGPYAYVQHPLYLGTFLVGLGLLVGGGSATWPAWLLWMPGVPLFLALFFGYYLSKKRRVEGDRLQERFAEAFSEYSSAVPRFVPSWRPYAGRSAAAWAWPVFRQNHEFAMDLLIVGLFAAMWWVPKGF